MTKDELYNRLLEKVQQAGGYVKFSLNPMFLTNNDKTIYISAIFEGCDDSSPLKVIDKDFNAFDLDDYFGKDDISWLLTYTDLAK